MTEAIRAYLLGIVAAALLSSILLALIPNGMIRKVGTIVAGLLLILVCLEPIYTMDISGFAQSIARIDMNSSTAASGVEVRSLDLTAELIKQNTEAYILDKAASMGVVLAADVTVSTAGEYPYPTSVVLKGAFNREQRIFLTEYIEANLAISAQAQEWIVG